VVWEIPFPSGTLGEDEWQRSLRQWRQFKREAAKRKETGEFDEMYLTQVGARNLHYYDGTVRTVILRSYPRQITVPLAPVIRLSDEEVDNVRRFASAKSILDRRHRILFECSPKSGQSIVTPEYARELARNLLIRVPDTCVILSSNQNIVSKDDRILDGSKLSFRENAELTKYCTLLVGCSSGISWLATSDWAQPLPTLQLLRSGAVFSNSMVLDHKRWGLPAGDIVEMTDAPIQRACDCLETMLKEDVRTAKMQFHEVTSHMNLNSYDAVLRELLRKGAYTQLGLFLIDNVRREGFSSRHVIRSCFVFVSYAFGHLRRSGGSIIRRLLR